MQRWSPEPLTANAAKPGFIAEWPSNTIVDPAGTGPQVAQSTQQRFHSDFNLDGEFACGEPPNANDRTSLRAVIAQELERDFAERQRLAELVYRDRHDQSERERDQADLRWREEFATQLESVRDASLYASAREAVRLAVHMAEKIVRTTVERDDAVLVRAIETVLHKVEAGVAIVVTVNPADAARLADDHALRARLRIAAVKEDRRIKPGGCLIAADRQEWDATIDKQLETLVEAVSEALAASPLSPEPEQDDTVGLE